MSAGGLRTRLILVLPAANDLTRTFGGPSDPAQADAILAAHETRRNDVGRDNAQFFLNVASMGLSVELTRQVTGKLKCRWGRLGNLVAALRAAGRAKAFVAEGSKGAKTLRLCCLQYAVGNGVYDGGGMAVHNAVGIDDQCVDFYSLRPQHLWRLPLFFRFSGDALFALYRTRAPTAAAARLISSHGRRCQSTSTAMLRLGPAILRLLPRALTTFTPSGEQRKNCEGLRG